MSGPIRLAALPEAEVREVESLPDGLEGSVRVGPYSVARPGEVLRVVPGLGRFLAAGGTRLDLALDPGADFEAAEPLIQGALTAALLHQRGELALHAAALAPPGGGPAVAICGDSGAGKSTLAYALVGRGWTLLAEDLVRVRPHRDAPVACPGRIGLRLCIDACLRFGLDPEKLALAPGDDTKRLIPTEGDGRPRRLGAVLILDRGGDGGIAILPGEAAAAAVYRQTYRLAYVAPLGMASSHWRAVAAVVAGCTVAELRMNAAPEAIAAEVECFAAGLRAGGNAI